MVYPNQNKIPDEFKKKKQVSELKVNLKNFHRLKRQR